MTVFVLVECDWSDFEVHGVFSTRAAAEVALAFLEAHQRGGCGQLEIKDMKLDELVADEVQAVAS